MESTGFVMASRFTSLTIRTSELFSRCYRPACVAGIADASYDRSQLVCVRRFFRDDLNIVKIRMFAQELAAGGAQRGDMLRDVVQVEIMWNLLFLVDAEQRKKRRTAARLKQC